MGCTKIEASQEKSWESRWNQEFGYSDNFYHYFDKTSEELQKQMQPKKNDDGTPALDEQGKPVLEEVAVKVAVTKSTLLPKDQADDSFRKATCTDEEYKKLHDNDTHQSYLYKGQYVLRTSIFSDTCESFNATSAIKINNTEGVKQAERIARAMIFFGQDLNADVTGENTCFKNVAGLGAYLQTGWNLTNETDPLTLDTIYNRLVEARKENGIIPESLSDSKLASEIAKSLTAQDMKLLSDMLTSKLGSETWRGVKKYVYEHPYQIGLVSLFGVVAAFTIGGPAIHHGLWKTTGLGDSPWSKVDSRGWIPRAWNYFQPKKSLAAVEKRLQEIEKIEKFAKEKGIDLNEETMKEKKELQEKKTNLEKRIEKNDNKKGPGASTGGGNQSPVATPESSENASLRKALSNSNERVCRPFDLTTFNTYGFLTSMKDQVVEAPVLSGNELFDFNPSVEKVKGDFNTGASSVKTSSTGNFAAGAAPAAIPMPVLAR